MWSVSPEDKGLLYVEFFPLSLEQYVNVSSSPERTAPYYINAPVDIVYDISVDLPEDWNLEKTSYTKESPYYYYNQDIDFFEKKLLISHNYKRKKDFVAAADVNGFVSDHDAIKGDLSYFITYNKNTADSISQSSLSWITIFLSIVFLVLSIYGAVYMYRQFDLPTQSDKLPGDSIGGWLILVTLGMVIGFFVSLVQLFAETIYWDASTLSILWAGEGLQGKPLVVLLIVELAYNIARIVYIILLIFLFFERRTIFPKAIIMLYTITLVFDVFDVLSAYALNEGDFTNEEQYENFKLIVGDIVRACIWIPYFLVSKRVKRTFVNYGPNHNETIASHPESLSEKEVIVNQ